MQINILELIKNKYLSLDQKLYEQAKQEKLLIFKGYRNKKIITNNGIINLKRRIYLSKETNKYVYLLDQYLKLQKYTQYDDQLIFKIQTLFFESQTSLSKIHELLKLDQINISRAQIHYLIHKFEFKKSLRNIKQH